MDPTLATDEFLAHSAWVRRLARRLLDDEADVDDLAQEAWMVLQRQPAGRIRDLQAWLSGVVHRIARRARHQRAARGDSESRERVERLAPSTEHVLEVEATRRLVVDAVLSLEEPYRSTLLLHFYAELPAREIAARLGLSGSTVRTRIQRGLARVREKLGARDPRDGGSTHASLVLLAEGIGSSLAPIGKGILVASSTTKLAWTGVAAVLLALGVVWFASDPMTEPTVPLAAADAEPSRPDAEHGKPTGTGELDAAGVDAGRVGVAGPAAPPAATAQSAGPRCRVLGRVIDEASSAVAGARVTIMSRGGRWSDVATLENAKRGGSSSEWLTTTTDASGRFEFEAPLPTADWIDLSITPDPYHAKSSRDFGPAGGRNKPRLVEGDNDLGDIQLGPRGAARGRVVSDDGRPIAGARINASNAGEGLNSNTEADEQGAYVIGHLQRGASAMSVMAEGWIAQQDIPVEIAIGRTTDVPDVVLAPAFRIDGFVVDEQGTGLPAITVRGTQASGSHARARTKPDGGFTLWVDKDEPCALEVRDAKGFEHFGGGPEASFSPGAQGVRIVLRRSALFTFRGIDAVTQEPIPRFGLRLDPKPAGGQWFSTSEREIPIAHHPGGETSVPFTSTWVVVSSPDHAPLETDVVADEGAQNFQTLALRPGVRIRGHLLLRGEPVENASVSLQREAIDEARTFQHEPNVHGGNTRHDVGAFAGRKRQVASGADGSFLFGGLAPGTYALTVEAPGVARKRLRGVEVPPEQTLDLGPILLEKGATIRGVLVAGVDESPEGFSVTLRPSMNVLAFGRLTEIEGFDGRFEFTGLEPGTHVLTWSRPSDGFSSDDEEARAQTLVLAEGEVREIVIDATASTPFTVSVRILRDGQPAPGIAVLVRKSKPDGNWSGTILGTSSADGVVTGEVDGDTTFDLVASRDFWVALGTIASGVVATPGGRIEREFVLSTGRIALELPAALNVPDRGLVRLNLAAPGRPWIHLLAATSSVVARYQNAVPWNGTKIEFGELEPGEYDATVHVQRTEGENSPTSREQMFDLREPYNTKVVVEVGKTATIVVP